MTQVIANDDENTLEANDTIIKNLLFDRFSPRGSRRRRRRVCIFVLTHSRNDIAIRSGCHVFRIQYLYAISLRKPQIDLATDK